MAGAILHPVVELKVYLPAPHKLIHPREIHDGRTKIQEVHTGYQPYSRRRTREEWQEHRQFLTRMHDQHYIRQEMPQDQIG